MNQKVGSGNIHLMNVCTDCSLGQEEGWGKVWECEGESWDEEEGEGSERKISENDLECTRGCEKNGRQGGREGERNGRRE